MPTPVETIKEKLPLEEVVGGYMKLVRSGKDLKGLCPFHGEKTPSFFVSPEKEVWHCFGCGRGGDLFSFVQEMEGIEFSEALRLLAERAGVELDRHPRQEPGKRERLIRLLEAAAQWYERELQQRPDADPVWEYLRRRGVTRDLAREFRMGFARNEWSFLCDELLRIGFHAGEIEEAGLAARSEKGSRGAYDRLRGRILFPILNVRGSVIGFTGRIAPWVAEEEAKQGREAAKYINTPNTVLYDKSRALFGLYQARTAIRKTDVAAVVEGAMDVVMMHKVGFRQAVAPCGTALTPEQIRLLQRYTNKFLLVFDTDLAGEGAARRALGEMMTLEADVKIVAMPEGMDPADMALKNPTALGKALIDASEGIAFFLQRACARLDRTTARGKKAILESVMPLLAQVEGGVARAHWIKETAAALGIEEKAVIHDVERERRRQISPSARAEPARSPDDGRPARKSRRQMVEERCCGLLMQFPELSRRVDRSILELFTEKSLRDIMNVALSQNAVTFSALLQHLPEDLRTAASRLAFQVEKRVSDADAAAKELEFLVRDLWNDRVREQMRAVSVEIRKAESASDGRRLGDLRKQFAELSQSLHAQHSDANH